MTDTTRRRLPYVLMDVFTDRPLEGNQLAIFTDARGLSTEQMQAIARETNLSETTFIFPRDIEDDHRAGTLVRIFTVQEELPFAGHPTLGTAYFLHRFGGSDEIWLDLKVGKIPVHFRRDDNSERDERRGELERGGPQLRRIGAGLLRHALRRGDDLWQPDARHVAFVRRARHTGITPCFFQGRSTRLSRAIRSPRMIVGRVSRGSMTSSISAFLAAM